MAQSIVLAFAVEPDEEEVLDLIVEMGGHRRPDGSWGPGDSLPAYLPCGTMRAVLSAWFSAGLIAGLALLALAALAPSVEKGHPVNEYAQVLRVHLPWLLFCVLMALAAGSYVREWKAGLGRAAVALPVPVVGGVAAAVVGTPQADTFVLAGLHLLEAVLGVVLGLALSRVLTARWNTGQEDARARGEWRKNRQKHGSQGPVV